MRESVETIDSKVVLNSPIPRLETGEILQCFLKGRYQNSRIDVERSESKEEDANQVIGRVPRELKDDIRARAYPGGGGTRPWPPPNPSAKKLYLKNSN